MTIISNPGLPQHAPHSPAGFSENQIKNPAEAATADTQGPAIIELIDIRSPPDSLAKTHGDIDYPSLLPPMEEALDGIESTKSKLGSTDLKMVLMDLGAILGMMFQFAKELQATGRMARKAASTDKINHSLSAAKQIETAGKAQHESAALKAALKIACGAIQIAASTISLGCSLKSSTALGNGDKAAAAKWEGFANLFNGLAKGMDSIIEGVGALYTADLDLNAAQANAQKAIYDALAQADESKGSEANEEFAMAAELMKKVLEVLQNQMDGSHNVNSRITGNMV